MGPMGISFVWPVLAARDAPMWLLAYDSKTGGSAEQVF